MREFDLLIAVRDVNINEVKEDIEVLDYFFNVCLFDLFALTVGIGFVYRIRLNILSNVTISKGCFNPNKELYSLNRFIQVSRTSVVFDYLERFLNQVYVHS